MTDLRKDVIPLLLSVYRVSQRECPFLLVSYVKDCRSRGDQRDLKALIGEWVTKKPTEAMNWYKEYSQKVPHNS